MFGMMLAMGRRTSGENLSKLINSYALIQDVQVNGTGGGTFTTGDWRTRIVNTVQYDPDGIVLSLVNNQFTLASGEYLIHINAPGHRVGQHVVRLVDDVNTELLMGQASYSNALSSTGNAFQNSANDSFLFQRLVLATQTTLEVQHRCTNTYSGSGMGLGFSDLASLDEIFTSVFLGKLA